MTTVRKAPPPPPPGALRNGTAAPAVQSDPNRFAVVSGKMDSAQRVLIYGPGKIGKSTLCSLSPNPVFLDIEDGTRGMNVFRIGGLNSFQDVRDCLQSPALDGYSTIVIDSATKLEELIIADVLTTVPNEKGAKVHSIEGYGFGRGLVHVYDKFLLFLADCDAQVRRGRHVVLIAHDCITEVPNPSGEDFIRYEPRLQSPKKGKNSIRNRVVEWSDHTVFLGYDVVSSDGKGMGGGTRTIYTDATPDHIAGSRTCPSMALPFENEEDATLWTHLLNVNNGGQE